MQVEDRNPKSDQVNRNWLAYAFVLAATAAVIVTVFTAESGWGQRGASESRRERAIPAKTSYCSPASAWT